ncbi:MAG TPA: hypothetical protein VJG83_02805 [archaeon]|nr:hypothetical protein [archaeon]
MEKPRIIFVCGTGDGISKRMRYDFEEYLTQIGKRDEFQIFTAGIITRTLSNFIPSISTDIFVFHHSTNQARLAKKFGIRRSKIVSIVYPVYWSAKREPLNQKRNNWAKQVFEKIMKKQKPIQEKPFYLRLQRRKKSPTRIAPKQFIRR